MTRPPTSKPGKLRLFYTGANTKKPASFLLELQQYSSAIFDLEAQHYVRRASTDAELQSWLAEVAEDIRSEVCREFDTEFSNFHCSKQERKKAVEDGLTPRIGHWTKTAATDIDATIRRGQAALDHYAEIDKEAERLQQIIGGRTQALPAKPQNSDLATRIQQNKKSPSFPRRASWLGDRLYERAWNRNDPLRHGGPDPKTIDKILSGSGVREDVLERLATALSKKPGQGKVSISDIPRD